MVNTIQNVETRSQAVASGKDAAQSTATRKIEIENGEGASTVGRLLRARRNRPLSTDNMTNHHQINNYIPVLQCKLPLDRIEVILSKIKKTESPTVDKSDNVKSDLSVQTELNFISTTNSDLINSDLMTNISGNASDPADGGRSAPVRIMCLFCDRTFVSNMLLQKHTERSHHISSNRRCSSRNVEQVTAVNFHPGCNICSKNSNIQTATNLNALFNHLLDEHAVKYFACRVCQIRFSTNDLLVIHNRDEHGVSIKDVEVALDDRVVQERSSENADVGKGTRSSNCTNVEKNSPSPYFPQFSPGIQFVQPKLKSVNNADCSLSNSTENVNADKESSDDSKTDKKSKHSAKKAFSKSRTTTALISYNQKDKHSKQSPVKDSRLLFEKNKPSDGDFVDLEENITASVIMPQRKSAENSNKKINIDQNAVIILDDINYDNKLFKNKQSTISNQMNLKPDEKDNQILSRLGIAQNRTSRARSLRRSRKTPLTENRSCSETPRKDKAKVKSEVADFVINKNKNDPNSKFDPDFYSNVSLNVRENLMKYLDGKLGKHDESPFIHDMVDPKIKSTHAVIQSPSTQPAEIHGSDVNLNAITIFPTLLTSDQYGSDKIPHYSYGANAQTFKKIITKNSWKWKWDPIKKYKYCNEDGKIVRKIRPLQHVSPRDLSKLDIWTQLTMREKFDQYVSSDVDVNVERATRNERQKQINELNMILDKRSFPDIESESKRCGPVSNENDDDDDTKSDASLHNQNEASPKTFSENISESLQPTESDHSVLNNLGLIKKAPDNSSSSNSVLSGEWARPRCYICCICGRRADCLRLLEAHQASHHPHVNSTYYEIVGQELLDTEVYKYLYLPGAKLNQDKTVKNDPNVRNLKKLTQSPMNMGRSSRILRTTTRSIKSLEKECTKCKKMLAPSEFYRHILECAGDYGWMMAKKKCKYKPFGARRRRLKGLYKREVPQEEERTEIKDQVVRPKIPPRPRIKPSDAETIQRMLANLPPKRASRQIHDLSSPKPKNNMRERKHHSAHQILNSKTNLTRNKISNGNVITSVKNSLAKKVMRLTRSVSNMKHPNLESPKSENVDKKISNAKSKKIDNDQDSLVENDSVSLGEQKNNIKSSCSKQCLSDVPSTKLPNVLKKVNVLSEKPQRNRGNTSKNDVLPAVSENADEDDVANLKNVPQKLTRRTVISSKLINTPLRNVTKTKNNLSKPSQESDGDSSVASSTNETLSQKQKKNKKKAVSFPLKWIGNKKVHFSKSKKSLKKKVCADVFETCENTDVSESLENEKISESVDVEHVKKASDIDVQDDLEELKSNSDNVSDTSTVQSDQDTPVKNDSTEEQNISLTAGGNDNPIEQNLDKDRSSPTNVPIATCSSFNFIKNMFSFNNNNTNDASGKKNTEQNNSYMENKTSKIINNCTPGCTSRSDSFFIANLTATKKDKPIEDKLIEPIRCPNSAYFVKSANIDKPPLLYTSQNSFNHNQYNMCLNVLPNQATYDTMKGSVQFPSKSDADPKISSKSKQPKSRKGLNDCIAMLKGKLGDKTTIFAETPKPPPIITSNVNIVVEDSQQPLDLSGRIPQPEDLSMKSSNCSVRPPQAPPPIVNVTPPKPVVKPLYDPILKIPQYSLSAANQRILSKSKTASNNSKAVQADVKKTKSDFSIPSLLSPDKKISHQSEIPKKTNVIEIPQIRPDISIFPKTFADTIEKLSSIQQEEIVNALPMALAQAVEIQLMKNINISTKTTVKSDVKQSKHHYIEDILSIKTSLPKDTQSIKSPPKVKEVASCTDTNDKMKTPTAIVEQILPIPEKAKPKIPSSEFNNVNTDLFLIDPVTGMITQRNATSVDECESSEIFSRRSKEIDSTVTKTPTEIIDLTKSVSDKPKETTPCTSMKKEVSAIETSICIDIVEKTSTNLRAVRIKSSIDKFNQKSSEYPNTSEFNEKSSAESCINQNSKSSDVLISSEVKLLDGICVESTTSCLKEEKLNLIISDVCENNQVFENPLEPAIQQDEVSSTQHSTIDDNSNSFPLESVCSKENEITNSEIVLDKPGEKIKSQKSQKTPAKTKHLKTQQIDNTFPVLEHEDITNEKNTVDMPKKWGRRKSNKKSEMTKNKKSESEDTKSNVNYEISKSKQNIMKLQENIKSNNIICNEQTELKDNFTKAKLLPVNTLRDLSEKTNSENLQQLSLKLMDQNIISEFALTPTNISELRTSDETERIENSSVLIPSKNKFKNKDVANDANEMKNMARALVEKKQPQKNLIEAYSAGDSIESSILTGEEGKTSQSEYPIASPIRTCTEAIHECISTRNVTISSANEESDDDICLADMAKKRFENTAPLNDKKIDVIIEATSGTKHPLIEDGNSENDALINSVPRKDANFKPAHAKKSESKQKRKSKSNKVTFVHDENEIKDKTLRSKTRAQAKAETTKVETTVTPTDLNSAEKLPENIEIEKISEENMQTSSVKNIKEFTEVSKKGKNRHEIKVSSPVNTRKSDRLSFTRSEISVEKINTINSVKLSENGHLIFKMQKEPDRSKVSESILNQSKNDDLTNVNLYAKKQSDKHISFKLFSDNNTDNDPSEVNSFLTDQNKIDVEFLNVKQNKEEKLSSTKSSQSKPKKSKHKRSSHDVCDNSSFSKVNSEESLNALNNVETKNDSDINEMSSNKNTSEDLLLANRCKSSVIDVFQNIAKKEVTLLESKNQVENVDISKSIINKEPAMENNEIENIHMNTEIDSNVTVEKLTLSKKKKTSKTNKSKINLPILKAKEVNTEIIEENITNNKDNFDNVEPVINTSSIETSSEFAVVKSSDKIESNAFDIYQNKPNNKIDISKNDQTFDDSSQPFLISSNNYDLRKLHKVKKLDNKSNLRKKHLNNKDIPKLSEAVEENIPLNEISMIYKDIKYDKKETLDALHPKNVINDEKSQPVPIVETENKNKFTKESKSKKKQSRKRCSSSSSSEDNVLSSFVSKEPSLPDTSLNIISQSSSTDIENTKQINYFPKAKSKRGRKQQNLNYTLAKSSSQVFEGQTLYSENNNKDTNILNVNKANCENEFDILQESSMNHTVSKIDEDKNTMVMLKDNKNLYYNPAGNVNFDISHNHDTNRSPHFFHNEKNQGSDISADNCGSTKHIEITTPEKDGKNNVEKFDDEKSITEINSQPKKELKLNLKIHHKKKKNSRKNSYKDIVINSEQNQVGPEDFNDHDSVVEKTKSPEIYFSIKDASSQKTDNQNENETSLFIAKENLEISDNSKPITENKKKKKKKLDHTRTTCIVSDEYVASESKTETYSKSTHEKKKKNKSNNNLSNFNNDDENVSVANLTNNTLEIDPYNFDMEQKETLIEPKKVLITNFDKIENKKSKNKKENLLSYFSEDLSNTCSEMKMKIKNNASYLKTNNPSSSKDDTKIRIDKHNRHDDDFTLETEIASHQSIISNIKNKIASKDKVSSKRDSLNLNSHVVEINEKTFEICEGNDSWKIPEVVNESFKSDIPTEKKSDNVHLSEDHKNSDTLIIDVNSLKVSKKTKKKHKHTNKLNPPITDIENNPANILNTVVSKSTGLKDKISVDDDENNFSTLLKIPFENKSDSEQSNLDLFSSNLEQPVNLNSFNIDKKSVSSVSNCIDENDKMFKSDLNIFPHTDENSTHIPINTTINDIDFQTKLKYKKSTKIHDDNSTQRNKKGKKEQFSISTDNERVLRNKTSSNLSDSYQTNSSTLPLNIVEPLRIQESKSSSILESASEFSESECETVTPLIESIENTKDQRINRKILINENKIVQYSLENSDPDNTNHLSISKSALNKIDSSVNYDDDSNISKSHANTDDESNKHFPKILSSDQIDYDDSDKASIIQDKYLADFGMYTEKRPRKSTILAIKKISQTFKPDLSDTDDVNDSANNSSSRQNTKHSKKKSKKSNLDLQTNVDNSSNIDVPPVVSTPDEIIETPLEEPEIIADIPKVSQSNDSLYDDQKYQEFKADTYCSICKRKFRRPENLLKHKTTLMHISKLSEIEAQEMKSKIDLGIIPPIKIQIDNNYISNEIPDQIKEKPDVMAKDNDNMKLTIDNATTRPYKNVAERKSFDLETLLNTSTSVGFVHPDTGMESLGRKELSRDEALFFECCSLLKESDTPRKNITESTLFKTTKVAHKSVEIDEKQKIKENSVLIHSLNIDSIIDNSNIPSAPITLPLHKEQFDDNCDSILSSVSNDSIASNKNFSRMDQLANSVYDYETENANFNKKDLLLKTHSDLLPTKILNVYENQISPNAFCPSKEIEADSLSSIKDDTENIVESSVYKINSLMVRSNSDDFSDNGDSLISNRKPPKHNKSSKSKRKDADLKNKKNIKDHMVELMPNNEQSPIHFDISHNEVLLNSDTKTEPILSNVNINNSDHGINRSSSISSNKKNNVSSVQAGETFSQIIVLEDKFDKIKRKAREKAQAAQEALSASMSPNFYTKSKKKTHSKSRKLSKSSDTSSKNSKISKSRRIPRKKTHTKELHKFENKKILTKGALKGFEGIKVSIPTQEINMNILETAKSNLQDLVDYALLNENISHTSDNNENDQSLSKDSYSKSSEKEFYTKYKNQNHVSSSSEYRNIKNNSVTSQDSQAQQQADVYDFFDDDDDDDDDDDEDNIDKNIKFPSPSTNSLNEKNSLSSKKINESGEKTGDVHNDDSQISSLSFSDRDDFIYMSDDYNVNQSEDDTISKSSNSNEILLTNLSKSGKKSKICKNKKITKKSAIMGRIFKNNAIRNEQKLLNNDQLFDSLLEKSSASSIRNASKASAKLSLEYSESVDYSNNQSIDDGDKLDNTDNTAASEAISDFDSEIDEKSRSPVRTHQRKIVPRLKARSSDDEILNPKDPSDKTENAILLETYQDNIGVASRKLQRKCTTGKQNVLAESWSSESDFEDFRQFEEYSSIPKPQRHHRRPRRSRRHCYSNEQKILENQNIEPDTDIQSSFVQENINPSDDFHDKFYDDNLDNDDFPTDRSYKLCDDLSIRKDSDTELDKHFDDGFSEAKNPRIKSKRLMFSKRRVSFNSTNIKNPESRRRRKQSQKPFDYDDEFKPTRIAEPLTTQKRNKRAASDKLYIWPSSSDEELPNTTVDTSSRGPEPIEQHGWIVGDSHKKLVTMLAHAKGRKLDDNATVKEKKSRLQS